MDGLSFLRPRSRGVLVCSGAIPLCIFFGARLVTSVTATAAKVKGFLEDTVRKSFCNVFDFFVRRPPDNHLALESRFTCKFLGSFSPDFLATMRGLYTEHLTNPRICYIPRDAIPASVREEVAHFFSTAVGKTAYIVNVSFNMIVPGRRIKFKLHYDVDCWPYEDNYQMICVLDTFERDQNNILVFDSDGAQVNPRLSLKPGEVVLMNPELYHCTAAGKYCRISVAIKITTTPVVTIRQELVPNPFVRHMADFVALLHYQVNVGHLGKERAFEEAMCLNNWLFTVHGTRTFRIAWLRAHFTYVKAFGLCALLRLTRQVLSPSATHVERQQKAARLLSAYTVPDDVGV